MMTKRRMYSGEFKSDVVCRYIRGDKSLAELSEEYQVHPNQIKNWKSLLLKRAPEVFEDKRKVRRAHR
jgi:transposase-like protein